MIWILILLLVVVYNIFVMKEPLSPMTTVKIKHKEITEKIQNVKDNIDKMTNNVSSIKNENTSNTKLIKETSESTDELLCDISDICK
jgi:peptidoglycan hydrolase CwlO-like protein